MTDPHNSPRPGDTVAAGGASQAPGASGAGGAPPTPGDAADSGATFSRDQVVSAATIVALVTIIAFEAMAVSTVMPAVGDALGVGGGYGLAFSSMFTAELLGIVIAGTWIAARGAFGSIIVGQVLIGAGSLLAGAAPGFGTFLTGRVVAGVGAGFVLVAVYVAVGSFFRAEQLPRVFAWLSAAWVLPSIIGPLLGAWLTEVISWRATFLVVVPLIAPTLAAMVRRRAQLREAGLRPEAGGRLDRRTLTLALLVAAGAGLVQWGGNSLVPPSAVAIGAVVAGLVLLGYALPRTLPPGTLRLRRGLPSVIGARFLATASFNSSVTYVPLFLVGITGFSLTASGVVLALSSIGWSIGSAIQGQARMAGRQQRLVVAGAAFCAVACGVYVAIALVAARTEISGWWMLVPTTLSGLGMGLAMASMSVLTLRIAPKEEHASASSSLQLGDVLGATLGLTLIGAVFASLVSAGFGAGQLGPTGGGASIAGIPVFVAIWLLTALIASVGMLAGDRIRFISR